MGKAITNIKEGRVSGKVKYTPSYVKAGTGKQIAQKAVIPTIINNNPYTNDAGELVQGSKVLMFITAWGKMADTCAKYLGVGKAFSCDVYLNSFESKVMDPATSKVILNAAGQPAVSIKHGFTMIPSSFDFGADSDAQIAKENRPLGWDGKMTIAEVEQAVATNQLPNVLAQAKQGPAIWEKLRADLKALVYTPGMVEFGKAEVKLPADGVQGAYAGLPNQIAAAIPMVDGLTYEAMKEAQWTDELLLTAEGGKYACLVPKKAPAPPVAPTPPAVPDAEKVAEMTAEAGATTTV